MTEVDFEAWPDLASRLLGGGVVACSDEFFAPSDSLVEPSAPVFAPRTFGAKGQVYDGWETRRRRSGTLDHDWAIVRLGAPGIVRGVVVDTSWFTGNYPPVASVDGCAMTGYPAPDEMMEADWVDLVPRSEVAGDARNPFPVTAGGRFTHVRLSIYPDGGVARLRVHGEAVPDPALLVGPLFDLAAMENGGRVIECSNMFYGTPSNMLLPGQARSMGEGWETARRRDAGNDWATVRLGVPGVVVMVELDTTHFKGNAPGAAALTGFDRAGGAFEILPRTRLQPDTRHRFVVAPPDPASRTGMRAMQVRLDIYPDGGLARLRLYGQPG
jgi:allantoicase